MLKNWSQIFFRGLFATFPIFITISFIVWLSGLIEDLFSRLFFFNYIPFLKDIPGVGILSGILLITLIGLLLPMANFLKVFSFIQEPLKNIPLVKSVYGAVDDLINYFGRPSTDSKVVKVKLPGGNIELMGLLTMDDASKIQGANLSEDKVAVYVPMSYAFGGYTIFVPRSDITICEMKVETLMKSTLTAWVRKN